MTENRFVLPETLVLLFVVICLIAAMTWIIPGGEYERIEKAGRTVVVPESFSVVDSRPQNVHTIFLAPVRGFIDAAQIIVFVLMMGGVFGIIQATGATIKPYDPETFVLGAHNMRLHILTEGDVFDLKTLSVKQ